MNLLALFREPELAVLIPEWCYLAQQQTASMSVLLIAAVKGTQAQNSGSMALSLPLGDPREILC